MFIVNRTSSGVCERCVCVTFPNPTASSWQSQPPPQTSPTATRSSSHETSTLTETGPSVSSQSWTRHVLCCRPCGLRSTPNASASASASASANANTYSNAYSNADAKIPQLVDIIIIIIYVFGSDVYACRWVKAPTRWTC